ncbi:MAG: hypothetical protein M1840_006652 [Geoglossum simile]|nr:MAG: hypothetical protein M1840_006652 [Geoglossum simile]
MARRKSGPISASQQYPTPIGSQDQQEKASGDAEHTETISCTDAERNGDNNVESAKTISRAETRSLNWAELLHEGEQQGKSKKRQQNDGDAESTESMMNGGNPVIEDELEAMYKLRLGKLEEEKEEDIN